MNAVITMCFGEFTKMAELTHPSIKAYAEKIGADFIVINEKRLSKSFVHYEKFQLFDMFGKYNRIIYMDTDVLVRDDCLNLFDIVKEDKLGIFNEGRFVDTLEIIRDASVKFKISLPKWSHQYYNTGVMVLSRIHRHIFKKPENEFDTYAGYSHFEQPYINLKIISENFKVQELSYKYNTMSMMGPLTGENRLGSYIVHYAGALPVETRNEVIKRDIVTWEADKPNYTYGRNIHVRVGGGLGDQIDAEPTIRFMCEKLYKNDNIIVQSDFPRIFKHLPVKIVDDTMLKTDKKEYFKIETLPSPETPLWQHLAQTLCHTVDFSSISALRRILSNEEKQIHLEVALQDISELVDSIGLRNLNNLILVHPGRGWPSKTFPATYWQDIINKLVEEGLPVAIIGKHLSDEQGIVDVTCPKEVLDLRNLLNLNELITLISQAKVLISNDSAPIHIAGAFDNYIILIPSCKHPDHVLPYRNGSMNYKTASLYKKLTTDAIDSSPTQVDGQTIDYVLGDINDYLLGIDSVVEVIKKSYECK